MSEKETVNHPVHYNAGKIEVIDAIDLNKELSGAAADAVVSCRKFKPTEVKSCLSLEEKLYAGK